MIYAENIFVCLIAPLLAGIILLRGEARRFVGFFAIGLLTCLLAAYINGFVVSLSDLTTEDSLIRLTPMCEEVLKALPVLLYLSVFQPDDRNLTASAIAVGLGFATLENVCLILQNGASELPYALVRGFSVGVMHTGYAAFLGYGLAFFRKLEYLLVPGAFSLLCVTSIFHSTYNLLVQAGGAWLSAGTALPFVVVILIYAWSKNPRRAAD